MKWVALNELLQPVQSCDPKSAFPDRFTYVDIAAIDRDAKSIRNPQSLSVHNAPSRARQLIQSGDVLVSTVRPNLNAVAHLNGQYEKAIASTGFAVLRPSPNRLDSSYLFRWVQTQHFVGAMVRQATGASYPAVSDAIVKGSKIPLPPLEEQKRIAAILDKADAIRRKREQAIKLADEFLRSLFLDMFGDPVSNPNGWPQLKLGDCANSQNGSTPPKDVVAYWEGNMPWVTPKDMKRAEITDSIDHVSKAAIDDQRVRVIPKNSVLIVVRGMILAHTVPIALNLVDCTINQDMKALQPCGQLDPVFLSSSLRSMHSLLLSRVTTSTHGTKKLDSEVLQELLLPVPPLEIQRRFCRAWASVKKALVAANKGAHSSANLQSSLTHRAFRGEL